MIHTSRIVMVGEQKSTINTPLILYRGDREVEIEFTITGHKFMFSNDGNVIKSVNATHGQLVINTPVGDGMFSRVTECSDGKVMFLITREMIDELDEVGFYDFQIRLFDDEDRTSRVTLPPVFDGIDIREPMSLEEEYGRVDMGEVDFAEANEIEEELDTFLSDGSYNKTNWEKHDVISRGKLNKIEDALYTIKTIQDEQDAMILDNATNIALMQLTM